MTTRTSGDCRRTRRTSPSDSPDGFVLTLWTRDQQMAAAADAAGVQRIGVDLECLGKAERQAGRGTWISPHSVDDLVAIQRVLRRAASFARTNALHAGSAAEIARLVDLGVDVLMMPMVASAQAAADFAGFVQGRALTIALIEDRRGLQHLPDIAAVKGVDEIHVGINDLALSLGLSTRWAVLTGALLTDACACVHAVGRPFGFGGIGRAGDETLPLPSDLVYAEYARVGATRALLARTFGSCPSTIAADVAAAQASLARWRAASVETLDAMHAALEARVATLATW